VSAEPAASSRVQALEVFVELLSGMDAETRARDFYDRLCEALCRLTTMERAALFLYDGSVGRVAVRGSHGVDPGALGSDHFTLEDAPIAERALAADRVVEVSEDIERAVPARYARLFGLTTLTCTPLSAAGYWLGVVFADRGGGRFRLTDAERDAMWSVGKVAALAASARIATRQQDRARRLSERIDLARDIHERVTQRIFGVSLALGSSAVLTQEERARCHGELQSALGDLRTAMSRPLAPPIRRTSTTLREELDRLARRDRDLALSVRWAPDAVVPDVLEPLLQSVAAESVRNATKHARPTRVDVHVDTADGNLVLEVLNDGISQRRGAPGMGLRIAALEALQHGGLLEFGTTRDGLWRVRLMAPLEPGESTP
jgi:signal transduction histidine kinase